MNPVLDVNSAWKADTHVVVGGQFGSEAKGHVCQVLATELLKKKNDYHVRVGGPNAGHTVYDKHGQKFAFRHLPVAAVLNGSPLLIGPGSEVDFEVLSGELDLCERLGHTTVRSRLRVHSEATILGPEHKDAEQWNQLRDRLGSTAKGIGAARAARLWRQAERVGDRPEEVFRLGAQVYSDHFVRLENRVLIEGTQGYGLGLHAGFYPFCTSGDCRNVDFVAQSGFPWRPLTFTWVVYRTHPIRVAGNSGQLYRETSWEQLSDDTGGYVQPEQTTVTKLTRRVGYWDQALANEALRANGGPSSLVFPVLSFVDYLDPDLAGCTSLSDLQSSPVWSTITDWESRLGSEFSLFLTGPQSHVWRG